MNRKGNHEETKDKCNLCGWIGPSDEVIEKKLFGELTFHCPQCDSEDLDDISFDPYDDDDDEGDGGKKVPTGPRPRKPLAAY